MCWIESVYRTPENNDKHIFINPDHVRAIRMNPDGKAIICWSQPNIGALTLLDDYFDIINLLREPDD